MPAGPQRRREVHHDLHADRCAGGGWEARWSGANTLWLADTHTNVRSPTQTHADAHTNTRIHANSSTHSCARCGCEYTQPLAWVHLAAACVFLCGGLALCVDVDGAPVQASSLPPPAAPRCMAWTSTPRCPTSARSSASAPSTMCCTCHGALASAWVVCAGARPPTPPPHTHPSTFMSPSAPQPVASRAHRSQREVRHVAPDAPARWDDLTVKEHLEFFAGLKEVPAKNVRCGPVCMCGCGSCGQYVRV